MISIEDVQKSFDDGDLVSLVFERYANDEEETQLVDALVDLHNSGLIDVLSIAPSSAFSALGVPDFFVGQHLLCKIIPRLRASSKGMMELVSALVGKAGEDLAANSPNRSLTEWLTQNPNAAGEIIEGAKLGDALSAEHLTFALSALDAIDEAYYFATEFDDGRRLSGITALSRMALDEEERVTTLKVLGVIANNGPDDSTRANLLVTTLKVALDEPVAPRTSWQPILDQLCAGAGPQTTHQASRALWSYGRALDVDAFFALSRSIETLLPENIGTAREIDFGIRTLLKTPLAAYGVALLRKLVAGGQIALDSKSSLAHDLPQAHPEVFHCLVVDWLLDGSPSLCLSLRAFLREDAALDLGSATSELTDSERYFVARKAIGYWFSMPVLATSVVISLIRTASGEVRSRLRDLLLNPILMNYGGAAHEYLSSIATDDPAFDEVQHALQGAKEYLEALKSVKMVPELRPPEAHLQAARSKWNEEMRRAMKDAEKESVMLSLISRSTLLYGRRSLTRVGPPGEKGSWSEFALHEHSAIFELPRMEVVDPNGIDHVLRVFRVEQIRR